jgi:histidinol dehydrogenase
VIEISAKNLRKYHEAQMPEEMWFTQIDNGILAGEKITPITSAGLYVPRGKGAFPSADGGADDATLFSAEVCGIKNVYKVGGAQAIAAMAYGTDTIPKVNKTLGPGSSYVSAAKRLLYGNIDVGTPAGPSESIILLFYY